MGSTLRPGGFGYAELGQQDSCTLFKRVGVIGGLAGQHFLEQLVHDEASLAAAADCARDCSIVRLKERVDGAVSEKRLSSYGDRWFESPSLAAARIREDGKTPLFRSAVGKTGALTDKPMNRVDAYRMIRRRTAEAGFKIKLGCHVSRATGITAYLEVGGTLENAQAVAAPESPRTTKLYDRTSDEITLDEVCRAACIRLT